MKQICKIYEDISDNPMTIKGLLLFIAIMFAFTFLVWGVITISQNMVQFGAKSLADQMSELRERIEALENIKVVPKTDISSRKVIQVSDSSYIPTIAKCDTTPFIMASGKRVYEGAIALSRDLERDLGLKFWEAYYECLYFNN